MQKLQTIFKTILAGGGALILVLLFSYNTTFAAPIYTPGETLSPTCAPIDPDCTVTPAAASGANSDIISLNALVSATSSTLYVSSLGTFANIFATDATTTNLYTQKLALGNGLASSLLAVDANGNVIATSTTNLLSNLVTYNYASSTFASTSFVINNFPTFTYATNTFLTIANAASTYYLQSNPAFYISSTTNNLLNYPTYTYASSTFASTSFVVNNFPTFAYASSTYLPFASSTLYVPYTGATGNVDLNNKALANVSTLSVGSATAPTGGVAYFNGNVGIGTSTPTSNLDVQNSGTQNIQQWRNSAGVVVVAIRPSGSIVVGSSVISGTNTDYGNGTLLVQSDIGFLGSAANYLRNMSIGNVGIKIWNGSSDVVPLLAQPTGNVLMNAGNVGIGTTSPISLLSVMASSTLPTSPFISFNSTTSPIFNVLANGNVGIGTTTPGTALVVIGTTTTSGLNISNLATVGGSFLAVNANGNVIATTTSGGGGTPAGSDTQIQYNNGGVFGANSGLTYSSSTNVLTITGTVMSGTTASTVAFTSAQAIFSHGGPTQGNDGNFYGVVGQTIAGYGVGGFAQTTGATFGAGVLGRGLVASTTGDTGNAYGVQGYATIARTNASGGMNIGGYFQASGALYENYGVEGLATAVNGQSFLSIGSYGQGTSNGNGTAAAGYFNALVSSSTGDTAQVYAVDAQAVATHAAGINYGVYSNASGGSTNYSFYGNAGNFYNAGVGQFGNALTTAGIANTGTITSTGQISTSAGNLSISGTSQLNGTVTVGASGGMLYQSNGVYQPSTGENIVYGGSGTLTLDTYSGSWLPRMTILNSGYVGIGTTTPAGVLSVWGTAGSDTLDIASSSNVVIWKLNSKGHFSVASSTNFTPTLSSCGTTPTIKGSDNAGIVTVGSVSATACTITFAQAYTNTPECTVDNQSMSVVNAMTMTVSNTAIVLSQTALTGDVLDYQCTGVGE